MLIVRGWRRWWVKLRREAGELVGINFDSFKFLSRFLAFCFPLVVFQRPLLTLRSALKFCPANAGKLVVCVLFVNF